MDDRQIIKLYNERSETAISETADILFCERI